MKELALIVEKLISEHREILKDTQSLEQAASDAGILVDLEKAGETFVPGRFNQNERDPGQYHSGKGKTRRP